MEGFWIDSFAKLVFKSALRNLKFTILLGALLFALVVNVSAATEKEPSRIEYLPSVDRVVIRLN
jgi:hypothetical protein